MWPTSSTFHPQKPGQWIKTGDRCVENRREQIGQPCLGPPAESGERVFVPIGWGDKEPTSPWKSSVRELVLSDTPNGPRLGSIQHKITLCR